MLTVLGCYGTFPGRDGACSGYLIREKDTSILLDCGNGTISRLQRYLKIEDIDALVLTHFHTDHTADAFTLKYALETKMCKGQKIGRKRLVCPLGNPEAAGELFDGTVFDVTGIDESLEFETGSLRITFVKMKHLIESYAVIINSGEGKFVYSGDTGYCDGLVKAAEGADLLLCESTVLENEGDARTDHHLSAAAAGRIASAANVRRLLLTHFWYEEDRNAYIKEACEFFSNVDAAEEFSTYSVRI